MKHLLGRTIGPLLLASVFGCTLTLAQSVFTIEDPPVDFEVIDAEPFDGIGDNGPYPTFNDAVLGTEGEARSMAEVDISTFSVPPGEAISTATLEIRITSVGVFGLGVDGETPDGLAVDGYIGNGTAELSDFQVGDGNVLDWVPTPDPWVGQVVSFDITSFVTDLVNAQERWSPSFGQVGGVAKVDSRVLVMPPDVHDTPRPGSCRPGPSAVGLHHST